MTYAQKKDKSAFFINVTTVLPASGRRVHPMEIFLGSAGDLSAPQRRQNGQSGKTASKFQPESFGLKFGASRSGRDPNGD